MTSGSTRRHGARLGLRTWFAGLALLILLPAAAAEPIASGHLMASEMVARSSVSQDGSFNVLYAQRPDGQGLPTIHFEGSQVTWRQVDDKGPAARAPDGSTIATAGVERSLGSPPAAQQDSNAQFDVTDAQGHFEFRLYSMEPLDVLATMDGATVRALQRPYVSASEGLKDYEEGEALDNPADPPLAQFTQFRYPTPLVLTLPEGTADVTVEGTFVLELLGISGTIQGDGGAHDVQSGQWNKAMAPGAPNEPAYQEERSFLRITVTGGSAHLVLAGDVETQWAGPGSTLTTTGNVILTSATGKVSTQDGRSVAVNEAHYRLPGHNAIQATPAAAGLDLTVTGLDSSGQPLQPDAATAQTLPTGLLWGLGLGITGFLLVGAAIWYLATRNGEPAMPDVEAALEAGHYRRAARDARRILRRHPGMETAVISRAIALSKAGKNRQVVAEVGRHLEHAEPSDGVLHYVLGIAYVDLGQTQKAEGAFQEALRRTPDLLPEVRTRLPSVSSAPAPSTKAPAEPHGYA